MPKMKPGETNFDHPAKTSEERGLRQRANNTVTNADIAREYGYNNLGGALDRVADDMHKQADELANKRKSGR